MKIKKSQLKHLIDSYLFEEAGEDSDNAKSLSKILKKEIDAFEGFEHETDAYIFKIDKSRDGGLHLTIRKRGGGFEEPYDVSIEDMEKASNGEITPKHKKFTEKVSQIMADVVAKSKDSDSKDRLDKVGRFFKSTVGDVVGAAVASREPIVKFRSDYEVDPGNNMLA